MMQRTTAQACNDCNATITFPFVELLNIDGNEILSEILGEEPAPLSNTSESGWGLALTFDYMCRSLYKQLMKYLDTFVTFSC